MEDALKARLIGATVLVALAVLLIPELLSGRKPAEPVAAQAGAGRGTRTFTIELDGASGSPVATQVARSPAPTTAPAAVADPRIGGRAGRGRGERACCRAASRSRQRRLRSRRPSRGPRSLPGPRQSRHPFK